MACLLSADAPPRSPKQVHHFTSASAIPQAQFQRTSSAGKHGSQDGSPISPKISLPDFGQYDSGTSGNSTSSAALMGSSPRQTCDQDLIDFDRSFSLPTSTFFRELDPLASQSTRKQEDSGPTYSVDSLFSDTTYSFTSTMSTSPETRSHASSSRHSASAVSPRQSVSLLDGSSPNISRPRPRPNSATLRHAPLKHAMSQETFNTGAGMGVVSSAPTSRPPSPLYRNVSPTGSVQSLPHYPTYATNDVYGGFTSDSSATSSLIDLSIDNPDSYWPDIEQPLPPLLGYLQQQQMHWHALTSSYIFISLCQSRNHLTQTLPHTHTHPGVLQFQWSAILSCQPPLPFA